MQAVARWQLVVASFPKAGRRTSRAAPRLAAAAVPASRVATPRPAAARCRSLPVAASVLTATATCQCRMMTALRQDLASGTHRPARRRSRGPARTARGPRLPPARAPDAVARGTGCRASARSVSRERPCLPGWKQAQSRTCCEACRPPAACVSSGTAPRRRAATGRARPSARMDPIGLRGSAARRAPRGAPCAAPRTLSSRRRRASCGGARAATHRGRRCTSLLGATPAHSLSLYTRSLALSRRRIRGNSLQNEMWMSAEPTGAGW